MDKSGESFVEKREGKIKKTAITKTKATLKYSVRNRKKKADNVKNMLGASGGSSRSLSENNFPMYDPFIYESGYESYRRSDVGYYANLNFRTDSNFPDVNRPCGPVAATNIMIYWKNRFPATCNGFMRGDGSWRRTFDVLRSSMHFFDDTFVGLFASGTELFMDIQLCYCYKIM